LSSTARWDAYFMRIAEAVALNSRCLSRQIGVVLARCNFILSTGYNGPPIGIAHCKERYGQCRKRKAGFGSGEGTHLCPAAHAEGNAIVIAARNGIHVEGATMYCTCPTPCRECAKYIINAGIKEVIVPDLTVYESEGELSGRDLLMEAKIVLRLPNKGEEVYSG